PVRARRGGARGREAETAGKDRRGGRQAVRRAGDDDRARPDGRSASARLVARGAGRPGAAADGRRMRRHRPRGRSHVPGGGAVRAAVRAGPHDSTDRDGRRRRGGAAPLMKKLAAFDLVILSYIAIVSAIVLAFRPEGTILYLVYHAAAVALLALIVTAYERFGGRLW